MNQLRLGLLLVILLLSSCQGAPSTVQPPLPTPALGTLLVDTTQTLGPISPYIYGVNYGPMHMLHGDVMPLALQAGFTAFRFPGGAWGDGTDLTPYQIDQYIEFCRQFNALPTISVRLCNGTPEKAAELVRYTNLERGYGVTYWSIGNEPSLYEQQTKAPYDTVRFNREWRAIAEAMKAVDPTIKLLGPELHQWGASPETTPRDSQGRDWMVEFLRANGDLVDVVTVHRYPLWKPFAESVTPAELRANTEEWDDLIRYLRQLIREHTGRDLPIAFTEINSDPRGLMMGEATPDTLYNAIWYADVLGQLGRNGVWMANYWVVSHRETGLGLFMGRKVRPTFYTFLLYRQFGQQALPALSAQEGVHLYAARRADGALTVMVINLNDEEQSMPLYLYGFQPKMAEIWRLDAHHLADQIGSWESEAELTLLLPPWSATLYVFWPER